MALRATDLADKLVEDNQARVEVGTLAAVHRPGAGGSGDAAAETAVAEATLQTAELALSAISSAARRPAVGLTSSRGLALAGPFANRHRWRDRRALTDRNRHPQRKKNLESNDVQVRFFTDQGKPAVA